MGAQIATVLFIQFQRPTASQIEFYLWGLPATVLFGWFMFLETRLLLLGEKLDRLPQDADYLSDRRRDMELAVLAAVLFDMIRMALLVTLMAIVPANPEEPMAPPLVLVGLFIIGVLFWGMRFIIIPTLAAVHHPIRPVLQKLHGGFFSLRIVCMGFAALLPVGITALILLGNPPETAAQAQTLHVSTLIADSFLSFASVAVLNASVACALKQILNPRRRALT
jgi:uncharacterized membrane protein